jgi:pimeloyl-ACP methyl ester carboxylesterase
VRERLGRIPEGIQGQVLIERYEADGMPPRYVVYVGPTETFSPIADGEPWDSTSNVYGVARQSPGSLRALEEAMSDAGIGADDEVVLVGFSQGGLLATAATGTGNWNVVGLETHGAPAGHLVVPEGVAGLAIRNTDDLVPALAGPQLDHTLVQVERRAFREGAEIPGIEAAPAHQRSAYDRTAEAIDDAQSRAVRDQVRTLDAFTADYLELPGGTATAFRYRAVRDDG